MENFSGESLGKFTTLTLNIGSAAVPRAKAIFSWLARRNDSVIVLTETSAGPGTRLLIEGLQRRGYKVFGKPEPGERGVLVATNMPVISVLDPIMPVSLPTRISAITVRAQSSPITIVGVYVPSRDRSPRKVEKKRAFIQTLLSSLEELPDSIRGRMMLVGDYNAIPRHHSPPRSGFFDYEYGLHDELKRFGFTGAHELRSGHRHHPHSWIGRTGNGYLYDYVHVSRGLKESVMRCAYLHGPRIKKMSDHAAVAVGWSST